MNLQDGPSLLPKLCKALGITAPVEKLVIEVPIDDVARVYVQQILEETVPSLDAMFANLPEEEKPIVIDVARVSVNEKGDIDYTPR